MYRPHAVLTAALAALTLVVAGCGSSSAPDESPAQQTASDDAPESAPDPSSDTSPSSDDAEPTSDVTSDPPSSGEPAAWPRTVTHAAGEMTIDAQPQHVVSTSVSLTGILLAIGAPLTATAAAVPGPLTDDQGFFTQWADVAAERGVAVLYPNLTLDLEAVDVAAPDLIVGSTIGQDNVADAYDQLSDIAPTVLLDYGSQDWTALATQLGEALGLEDAAQQVIADYDDQLADTAATMTAPEGTALMISYTGADGANIFNPSSAQAHVLTSLGFDYVGVDQSLVAQQRSDISTVTLENLPAALADVDTIFVLKVGASSVDAVKADPLLTNVKAVADGQLKELAPQAFRIDYYSGLAMAGEVAAMYAG